MAGRCTSGGGRQQKPQGKVPQPDEQLEEIQNFMGDTWGKLNQTWKYFGYDPDSIRKRKGTVELHVKELLTDMHQEALSRVTEKEDYLEELKKEMAQLSKELTLDGSVVSQAISKAKDRSLLESEGLFLEIANDLRKRKEIRMEKYHQINNKVIELSVEMGDAPITIEFDGIPSDAQVAKLEQDLSHLHREKQRRQSSLKKLKKSIISLFECVERIPKNELERVISDDNPPKANCSLKVLSMKVLQDMEELEFSLKHQVQVNAEEGEKIWQKIRELWSRLTIDEEVRIPFEKVHRGIPNPANEQKDITYKPSALKGLQIELTRLEEEKRRNMSLFITQVREELISLWISKCFMHKVETRFRHSNYAILTEFTEDDFISDLYTEDLLEKHETEVEYWRMFAERNKKIIDGIIKRGHMFNQYQMLDQKSDDPARLANRGGALLKEEKERKTLEKAIPKLENELKLLSNKFEEDCDAGNGMRKFLVYDKEIPEMIELDWRLFHEEKDKRKESRKKPTDANAVAMAGGRTMMTTHLGPSGSRKRPATPSSAHRVGLSTPVKRNKIAPATPNNGRNNVTGSTPFAHPSGSIKKPAAGRLVASGENFTKPATRSRNVPTPVQFQSSSATKSRAVGSKIPGRGRGGWEKEQVNPIINDVGVKSPDSTYSDFTVPLMSQSTLNSSAVSTAMANSRKPLSVVPTFPYSANTVTTPTKSDPPVFTSAKRAASDNEYF